MGGNFNRCVLEQSVENTDMADSDKAKILEKFQ